MIRPELERFPVEGSDILDLNGYFHAYIVGGPGSFSMVVAAPEDFSQTVARKLTLEIASLPGAPQRPLPARFITPANTSTD